MVLNFSESWTLVSGYSGNYRPFLKKNTHIYKDSVVLNFTFSMDYLDHVQETQKKWCLTQARGAWVCDGRFDPLPPGERQGWGADTEQGPPFTVGVWFDCRVSVLMLPDSNSACDFLFWGVLILPLYEGNIFAWRRSGRKAKDERVWAPRGLGRNLRARLCSRRLGIAPRPSLAVVTHPQKERALRVGLQVPRWLYGLWKETSFPTLAPLPAISMFFAMWFFCFSNHAVESIFTLLESGLNLRLALAKCIWQKCRCASFEANPQAISPSPPLSFALALSFFRPSCQENILRRAGWRTQPGRVSQSHYMKECPPVMRKAT